jgi:hypothetical protein
MKSPQLSSLRNIVPMKPWLARCAFFLGLFLIGSFWTHRGSSAEFDRIGIVSAFDPELMAIEQAIIPKRAESRRFLALASYANMLDAPFWRQQALELGPWLVSFGGGPGDSAASTPPVLLQTAL